jgi:hypothetical protein
MPMIRIPAGSRVRLVDLVEQLTHVPNIRWSILEMWAVAREDDTDILSLEEEAASSPTGLAMSSDRIIEFARSLREFNDGIIVGYITQAPARSTADLRTAAEVVIEAFDSSYWRVYSRDGAMLDALRPRFADVTDVVPEPGIVPVH